MGQEFQVKTLSNADHDYFMLSGTMDASAEKQLQELPGKVRTALVRIDFSQAGRINSMGIALLLRCFREIRETKKAEIRLLALSPMNSILFKMTGVFILAKPEQG